MRWCVSVSANHSCKQSSKKLVPLFKSRRNHLQAFTPEWLYFQICLGVSNMPAYCHEWHGPLLRRAMTRFKDQRQPMSTHPAVVLPVNVITERSKVRLQRWWYMGSTFWNKKVLFSFFFLLLRRILTLAFLTIASITHVKPLQQATPVRWAAKWIRLRNNTGRWMPDVKAAEGSTLPCSSCIPLPLLGPLHGLAGLCFSHFDTND